MRIFRDKYIYLIVFVIFFSCKSEEYKIQDHLTLISNIKNKLKDANAFKRDKTIYINNLHNYFNENEVNKLKKLHLFKIIKIRKNYVFYFQDVFKSIDNSTLNFNNSIISILIFGKNRHKRENIAYYEQFAECRINFQHLKKNWTLIQRHVYCQD